MNDAHSSAMTSHTAPVRARSAPQREFQGVWIPREIWDSDSLSWLEKCLLAEIKSLEGKDGCFAGNEYLANRFRSTPGSIATLIGKLRASGWIRDVKFDGRTRWLRIILKADTINASLNQTSTPIDRALSPRSSQGSTPVEVSKPFNIRTGTRREKTQKNTATESLCAAAQTVVDEWNKLQALPKIVTLSSGRRKKLNARLREPFFADNWRAALKRIAESKFCTGDNPRQWVADFEFFLRPDSVAKIIEGKYDNKEAKQPTQRQGAADWSEEEFKKGIGL